MLSDELFSKTPIPKAYMMLALPVVMSMVVQLVYSMVDTFFISLTGNTALIAGVSICTPLFTLMLAFGDLFGLGGSSVISRLFGGGKKEEGKRLSIFCFYGAAAFGLAVSAIMLVSEKEILWMLGAEGDVAEYASAYYRCFAAGAAFVIFSLVPANLLRAAGHPRAAMNASILGAAANIVLDPVLIFGMELGAGGAAMATIAGYICSDMYTVWYIRNQCSELSLNLPQIGISKKDARAIFAIGLAAAVTNFTQTIGIAITNNALLEYGSDAVAVFGIVMKVVMIVALVVVGLAFGGQPLMGYAYGAKDVQRFVGTISFALKAVIGTGAALAACLAVFSEPVMKIFLSDPALVKAGAEMMLWQLPAIVFMGAGLVLVCMFQATGKSIPSLILSLCRQGIVYAVVLAMMSSWFGYNGIIASQLVADVVTVVIGVGLYRSMSQKRNSVVMTRI